ncbi:MAG: (Fe-S)-binding protein [Thermoplasmata archaeon]|nr:(Fe-S)-binding protein [Thermoplasmata archaeon]
MSILDDLDLETSKCISCTFCESVCPTLQASDYRAIFGARGRVLLAREMVKEIRNQGKSSLDVSDPFYSCLDCYACFNVCPAGVNAGHVSEMAKSLITHKKFLNKNQEKQVAKMIITSIMKFNSPLGLKNEINSWSHGLHFDENSDYLLYTGGMYQLMAYSKILSELERKFKNETIEKIAEIISKYPSIIKLTHPMYDDNLKKRMDNILKSIYNLLKAAGIKFKYIDDEPYPGSFLYELGYIDDFIEYGKRLKDLFIRNNVKNIITIDPHTYEILKAIYPKYIEGFNFNVYHYLDFLDNLNFSKGNENLVYHEPCHFSMHKEKYNEPIKFICKLGEIKFPERHGNTSYCCGGPAELLYPDLSSSISNKRFNELKNAGGDKIITACPICFANLSKDDTVFDIAEILEKRLNKNINF